MMAAFFISILTPIAALFGISILRLLAIAGIALGIVTGVGVVTYKIFSAGEAHNQSKIDKQSQGAKNAADKAARDPDECNDIGGMWDVTRGRCQLP